MVRGQQRRAGFQGQGLHLPCLVRVEGLIGAGAGLRLDVDHWPGCPVDGQQLRGLVVVKSSAAPAPVSIDAGTGPGACFEVSSTG